MDRQERNEQLLTEAQTAILRGHEGIAECEAAIAAARQDRIDTQKRTAKTLDEAKSHSAAIRQDIRGWEAEVAHCERQLGLRPKPGRQAKTG